MRRSSFLISAVDLVHSATARVDKLSWYIIYQRYREDAKGPKTLVKDDIQIFQIFANRIPGIFTQVLAPATGRLP